MSSLASLLSADVHSLSAQEAQPSNKSDYTGCQSKYGSQSFLSFINTADNTELVH